MLWCDRGGPGREPVLVLVHGLAGTAELMRPLLAELLRWWPADWLLVDLPGHGRSGARADYSYAAHAAELRAAIGPDRPAVVVGHSMGAAVGLALAAGNAAVPLVIALDMKLRWSPEDLDRVAAIAERPNPTFTSRSQAVARWLAIAGVRGLWMVDQPGTDAAVAGAGTSWRLTFDNKANGVGAPPTAELLAAMPGAAVFAHGAHDQLVAGPDIADVPYAAEVFEGLGHNPHVEAPARVAEFVRWEIEWRGSI